MDDSGYTLNSSHEQPDEPGGVSRWEWLPPLVLAALAACYFLTEPGGGLNRFALFVGLALVPGTVWRLSGRSAWGIHRICFAVALIFFVLDNPTLRPDAASWQRILERPGLVLLGFAISFAQPLWGMLRTHCLLVDGGIVITYFNSLKLCLSGSFFNMFLPGSTGGDAYRIYAITNGYKVRVAPAVASITLDRLLGLPSLLLVVALGMILDYDFFAHNHMLAKLIPFLAGAAAVCVVLLAYLMLAGKSGRRIARMQLEDGALPGAEPRKPGRLKRLHLRISANIKRPSTLPLSLFYGFMSHLACIASCQCFAYVLGVEGVPFLRYYLIVPMVMTINSIPGAPGGVGQGELAMATLLDMASPGMGNAQAGVMVMLLFRLSNMAMGVLGGFFYAMGKTELVGLSHVSQGVTKILQRDIAGAIRRNITRISATRQFRAPPPRTGEDTTHRRRSGSTDTVRLLHRQSLSGKDTARRSRPKK